MKLVKTIYLIDDDTTFRFLTKKVILSTQLDIDIVEFGDGQEAINHLTETVENAAPLPDIIFLDLSMPIMDGWEFLEDYNNLHAKIQKNILLFIVSSSISPHDIDRAKNYSIVSDFIIKPVSKEKFIQIIEA